MPANCGCSRQKSTIKEIVERIHQRAYKSVKFNLSPDPESLKDPVIDHKEYIEAVNKVTESDSGTRVLRDKLVAAKKVQSRTAHVL